MTMHQSMGDSPGVESRWVLNPATTTIVFRTKAMWILNVKGTAKALNGDGIVAPDGPVSGRLVIDATSIDTHDAKRDKHLRTGDFLETAKYPTITFVTTSGRVTGTGTFELNGTLTVRDQTHPVTMSADVRRSGSTAVVSTEIDIDRSMWGLTWAKMGAGLHNRVAIEAHFDEA